MATATEKKPKTIEFFKRKLENLRQQHNKNCAKYKNSKKDNWKASLRAYYALKAEHAIVLREVEDAGLGRHILDTTITFQSGKGYEDNYDLEKALNAEFPQGHGDSESGQGFFYINRAFQFVVVEWLKGRAEEGSVRTTQKQDDHTGLK